MSLAWAFHSLVVHLNCAWDDTLCLLGAEPRNISRGLGISEKGEEGGWWRKEEQGREREEQGAKNAVWWVPGFSVGRQRCSGEGWW